MTIPVGISDTDNAESEFLDEIRYQFDRDEDIRKTLDKKSSTMITISSTIFTLLSIIGSFMINNPTIFARNPLDINYNNFSNLLDILIAGVIAAITSIILFVRSYAITKYHYPVGAKYFFKKDKNITTEEKINKFRYTSKKKFTEYMIEHYLDCIKDNSESNEKKALLIRIGHYLLTISICLFGILLIGVIYLISVK
jgi:hypothetical protein